MPVYLYKHEIEQALTAIRTESFPWRRYLQIVSADQDVIQVRVGATSDRCDWSEIPFLIVADSPPLSHQPPPHPIPDKGWLAMRCWRGPDGEPVVDVLQWEPGPDVTPEVIYIPGPEDVFARHRGLIETDHLMGKRALVLGAGSVGSACAVELAKSGVGRIDLVDHDRLEVQNIARHACGISSLGRLKVRAVRDLLLDKNPGCQVEAHAVDILQQPGLIERLVEESDVVLVATDNNATRRLANAASLRSGATAVFGRAMTRACGLDVIRVRPGGGPCYQCLTSTVLAAGDEEISTPRQASQLAYADRPVRAEPGLSNDLAPLSQMMVKLSLQALLVGTDTDLRSLDDDLTADLYLWANRRTDQHRGLTPMGTAASQPTVMRWYGVDTSAVPRCGMCGGSTDPSE